MPVNPKYYEKMSHLLDSIIQTRKQDALDYQAYLSRITDLARQVHTPESQPTYPERINRPALRALYDNLDQHEELAVELDASIRATKKDDWRGHRFKEREVRNAVREVLARYEVDKLDDTMEIVKNQREY
jgi:type I restriction enzyme R subunit